MLFKKKKYIVPIFLTAFIVFCPLMSGYADENSAPEFTDGASTTRSIAENTRPYTKIGTAVAATDADNDTLTYSLSGPDAFSFSIVSTSGQLQTKAALNYEADDSYAVTVSVSDRDGGSDSIAVTINVTDVNEKPSFGIFGRVTLSVAENTASGTNIGGVVAATDEDTGDTFTYHLGGTDADSFRIVRTSGQLQTKAALDYETKDTYTVAVTVYDGNNGGDRITVTINVTDAVGAAPSVQTPPVLPKTTELLSNFPNPFNPETWIPYQLAKPADVTLTIYDIRGRIVRTLRLGHQPAGFYQNRSKAAYWDGRNYLGEKVATGVYFYTLKAGDYTATRKLLIRK